MRWFRWGSFFYLLWGKESLSWQHQYCIYNRVRTQDYTGHHHYSRSHIPDITVADYDGRGSTLVVEVSVFRPTCGAHLAVAAGDPPGGASRDVEQRRRADYGALAPGVRWLPFVLDTL